MGQKWETIRQKIGSLLQCFFSITRLPVEPIKTNVVYSVVVVDDDDDKDDIKTKAIILIIATMTGINDRKSFIFFLECDLKKLINSWSYNLLG